MKKSLVFLLLGGCMVGPNYVPPENCVSDNWASEEEAFPCTNPSAEWWKVFNEPLLGKYIETAAHYNNNILKAEANISYAWAYRKVTASALFPQINADVNATKTYFSKNGPIFTIGQASGNTSDIVSTTTGLNFTPQIPQIQTLYNVLFLFSWEIDLFGKTRRAVEAADAFIGSAIEQRNDVLISVLAEVARNYMEVRSFQRQAVLLEQNIAFLEETLYISKKQRESGLINELDLERIQIQLDQARTQLPNLIAQVYRGIYSISVLTGQMPECLMPDLLPELPLPKAPGKICVGLRSDLLRRRPDVRKAERDLAAATANIGVAVASFFPTITLLADAGLQSLKLSNLFSWRSRTWAIGGDMFVPIYQGGKLRGQLWEAEARAANETYNYQQTVLNAIQEAETTLISYSQDLKTAESLKEAVEKERNLVYLTRARYEKGLVSLPNLLTLQRELNSLEQQLVQTDTSALLDLVLLYKALGGGWEAIEGEGECQ